MRVAYERAAVVRVARVVAEVGVKAVKRAAAVAARVAVAWQWDLGEGSKWVDNGHDANISGQSGGVGGGGEDSGGLGGGGGGNEGGRVKVVAGIGQPHG